MDKNRRRIAYRLYSMAADIYLYMSPSSAFTCEAANAQDRTGNEELCADFKQL